MASPAAVGVVGTGPGTEAVRAALEDVDVTVVDLEPAAAADVDLAVAVSPAGAPVFDRLNASVTGPWLAVELGGIGGMAVESMDAAVSVLGAVGCFECLRHRVRSNPPDQPSEAPRTTRSDARLAGAVAGRLAVALVSGEDVAGRVVELPYVERELLPVPDCECEGDPSVETGIDRTHGEVPLDAAADRMERAVDGRVGIVRSVGEAHSFPVPYYLARLCDTTGFSDAEAGRAAAGVAAGWTPALVKALGEALERYAAGCYRSAGFDLAPATDRPDGVPPSAFVLSPNHDDPDPAEPIPWVPGESVDGGEAVSLPAEFAVFPPPERRHRPSITTGLGLHTSGVGALLSGLYEVVERDATMLAWYSTFEPLGLRVSDPAFDELARRARSEELSVTPLLVTQDVDVPVVAVAVHREGAWPRFAVGSAANLDARGAARAALEEALQNWTELRAMGRDRAIEEQAALAHHADLPEVARGFVDTESVVPVSGVGPEDPPTGAAALDALLDRLGAVGLESFATRLTTRDVERLGLEVVRVLVPSAQPLFTGDAFFGERARSVPEELGFAPKLERAMHPYP